MTIPPADLRLAEILAPMENFDIARFAFSRPQDIRAVAKALVAAAKAPSEPPASPGD